MKPSKLEDVKKILLSHPQIFKQFNVARLRVFGSFATGKVSDQSDIDILVDFHPDAEIGFFEFLNLQYALEDLLGRKVDLVSEKGIHPALKKRILNEAVNVA